MVAVLGVRSKMRWWSQMGNRPVGHKSGTAVCVAVAVAVAVGGTCTSPRSGEHGGARVGCCRSGYLLLRFQCFISCGVQRCSSSLHSPAPPYNLPSRSTLVFSNVGEKKERERPDIPACHVEDWSALNKSPLQGCPLQLFANPELHKLLRRTFGLPSSIFSDCFPLLCVNRNQNRRKVTRSAALWTNVSVYHTVALAGRVLILRETMWQSRCFVWQIREGYHCT